MSKMKELSKGLFKDNPIFVLMLGLCPVLGVSTQVSNAIGMSAGVMFVLLFSNMIISALRKIIPASIHIPAYIVVIASLVSFIQMVMHAYVPSVYNALGVYLPLIVVNCIILGRAEAFASKNTVVDSMLDAIGMSIGFALGLTLIALIRELFGSGTITLFPMGNFSGVINIPWFYDNPIRVFSLAPGALLIMGFLKAFFDWNSSRKKDK
ncbi:electron transport complex subunit RsxE [Sphaerochaeta halotolerans]|jgi:electron transport complex protein RnfE|uniref:Ion-translocating oxidoreductase complex subunit E n=1 Tax=Sphaerochaeta halotolerans TaxID=2293840 RepID=A0A372MFV8_9SPIR|nr:electron transport complex subunit E [Sphaerochaeta halotolerans]MBG0766172.1 electron transport complex subunit E [Spirochaetaceae bacterium]MDK2860146.1 H+/Na+-translocating ferredoxin:NAD+ oxidoreductase subunit [Sphaerochaeta sp.]MDN5333398.1 H+/Na+-translocating ferredoxin:NAD+ oxidoreductase subunit [Sphaerochaeta sp.]MXI86247.1 RnfABCDGE type electron transport complex subunit E [Sphaerochaeta halotolerans]RFU94667.1 electron transport complex subunit E [Sphaerochaeta halotolerans]